MKSHSETIKEEAKRLKEHCEEVLAAIDTKRNEISSLIERLQSLLGKNNNLISLDRKEMFLKEIKQKIEKLNSD